MKLEDYQNLEQLAAKRGAIMVDAADLLAWCQEMAALREWGKQAYRVISYVNSVGIVKKPGLDAWHVEQDAPDEVKS